MRTTWMSHAPESRSASCRGDGPVRRTLGINPIGVDIHEEALVEGVFCRTVTDLLDLDDAAAAPTYSHG